MATFKFNFSNSSDVVEAKDDGETEQWFESEEIFPNKQFEELDKIAKFANMYSHEDTEIGYVIANEVISSMEFIGNEVFHAEKNHSDLITAKYEGGLKVWECTSDLIEYLINKKEDINLENKDILDLGCGAGLLGIYAFLQKASSVVFQDYNKEVIEYCTIPNVLLNIENEDDRQKEIKKCRFFSGDWLSFNKQLDNSVLFNTIFTSETIYNPSNYDKLIEIFSTRLKADGEIYIAAKTYYFGVGGGVKQFEKELEKSGKFTCESIWKSAGGIQREILKIKKTK